MMEGNVEIFKGTTSRKIITPCPHCFNTLKNEYPQYGGNFEVVHHSEFIKKLLDEGKVKLTKKVDHGKLTLHDSCYLGRYNEIYEQPRAIISATTNGGTVEMGKHGKLSFLLRRGRRQDVDGGRHRKAHQRSPRENGGRRRRELRVHGVPVLPHDVQRRVQEPRKRDIKVYDISQLVVEAMDDGLTSSN